jgi:hypothetical protein
VLRYAQPGKYARVLIMSIVVLALMIGLPDSEWGTAAIVLLEGALLVTVVQTSNAPYRRSLTWFAIVVGVTAAGFAPWGRIPNWLSVGMGGILVALTLATLLRGAIRTLKRDGVTVQLVFAGLSVYVVLGVLFAMIIGTVADVTHGFYFAQHTDGNTSDRVYFSFVTLTTTGFGDFTPATQYGKAIAVCEVLIGEIYLLTVVSLLVGNLRPGGPLSPPVPEPAAVGATAIPAATAVPASSAGGEPPLPPPD